MDSDDLSKSTVTELLSLYSSTLGELKKRGVTRSTNNPAADYAELVVSTGLGLTIAPKVTTGFDATDPTGQRYQIKGRRITAHNKSRQLSFIRGLDEKEPPFDFLAGVLFNEDFSIFRACVIPFEVVKENSKFVTRVNGWRFLLRDIVWGISNVRDITNLILRAVDGISRETK